MGTSSNQVFFFQQAMFGYEKVTWWETMGWNREAQDLRQPTVGECWGIVEHILVCGNVYGTIVLGRWTLFCLLLSSRNQGTWVFAHTHIWIRLNKSMLILLNWLLNVSNVAALGNWNDTSFCIPHQLQDLQALVPERRSWQHWRPRKSQTLRNLTHKRICRRPPLIHFGYFGVDCGWLW